MPDKPRRRRAVKALLVLLAIVGLTGGLWIAGRALFDHLSLKYLLFDRRLDRAFDSVRVAMSRAEVVERMGKPVRESPEFELGQRDGFEDQYERAEESNAETYLIWHTGIDYVYCIGFDDKDKVAVKGKGGT